MCEMLVNFTYPPNPPGSATKTIPRGKSSFYRGVCTNPCSLGGYMNSVACIFFSGAEPTVSLPSACHGRCSPCGPSPGHRNPDGGLRASRPLRVGTLFSRPVPRILDLLSSLAQSRPFDLLGFPCWSIFRKGSKRLTFYF